MGERISIILKRHQTLGCVSVVSITAACLLWLGIPLFSPITTNNPYLLLCITGVCLFLATCLLFLRFFIPRDRWISVWLSVSPALLCSVLLVPHVVAVPAISLCIISWLFFALWGYHRYYPLTKDHRLHKARFARR